MPISYNEEEYYTEEEAIRYLNVSPDYFERIKRMKVDGMPPKWVLQPHTIPGQGRTVFYEKEQLKSIRSI